MRIRCAALVPLIAAAIVGGCTSTPSQPVTRAEVQWPPLPTESRIRYLYSIKSPADLGIRRGLLSRAWRLFKGEGDPILGRPTGLYADRNTLLVTDTGRRTVHVFELARKRYDQLPRDPVDEFQFPVDAVRHPDGRIFVTDSVTGVIHIFDDGDYAGAFGRSELRRPTGIALSADAEHALVVDTAASEVLVFSTHDYKLERRTGDESMPAVSFHYPTHIAIDGHGTVLVTDALNFRVQLLGPNLDAVSSIGAAGDGPGYFSRPKGLAVDDEGHIYVADALFDNVQVFRNDGAMLLAFGESGQGPGQFWLPADVAIDEQNHIYVADSYNGRVQVFEYLRSRQSP